MGGAVGLLIWGVFFVGLSDNIIRPILLNRGVNVHPLLILLSVLGGLVYFGPIGFIAGPVVIAFFFVLLDVYPLIMKGRSIPEEPEIDNA
jgi:predicted PurR-regulated permease PerM